MQPEAKKLLWDVREAAAQVELFTAGRDLEDYLADAMLRSAVERQVRRPSLIRLDELDLDLRRVVALMNELPVPPCR